MVESKSFGSRLFDVLNYALLFVLTVVFLYPLWYVLVGSISDPVRLFMHNGRCPTVWSIPLLTMAIRACSATTPC